MKPSHILRQRGTGHLEPRLALTYAMVHDVPEQALTLEQLEQPQVLQALRAGALPVGSVAFVQRALDLLGLCPSPPVSTYPEALRAHLRRDVVLVRKDQALRQKGPFFVKPDSVKAFTGFVCQDAAQLGMALGVSDELPHLKSYFQEQEAALQALPPDALVWLCEPVRWLREFRCYVHSGEVLGVACYQEAPDLGPSQRLELDWASVQAMVQTYAPQAPVAYALDVGVLENGQTALVEINDGWALGLYDSVLSRERYIEMLQARWHQIWSLGQSGRDKAAGEALPL